MINWNVPDYLRGFRCKCGARLEDMHLSYKGRSRVQEMGCSKCNAHYVKNRIGQYVLKEVSD